MGHVSYLFLVLIPNIIIVATCDLNLTKVISMSSRIALQSFSLNNNIAEISPQDEIFRFDVEANKQINREAPWGKE